MLPLLEFEYLNLISFHTLAEIIQFTELMGQEGAILDEKDWKTNAGRIDRKNEIEKASNYLLIRVHP